MFPFFTEIKKQEQDTDQEPDIKKNIDQGDLFFHNGEAEEQPQGNIYQQPEKSCKERIPYFKEMLFYFRFNTSWHNVEFSGGKVR